MRNIMFGVLGAIAIAIAGQSTTFAATYDVTVATTRQTLSSPSSAGGPYIPGDSNLSNQNNS